MFGIFLKTKKNTANQTVYGVIFCGGDKGDRTPDLMTASHALSQLSYAPELGTMISILGRPLNVNINFCFFNIFFRAPAGAGSPVRSAGSGGFGT